MIPRMRRLLKRLRGDVHVTHEADRIITAALTSAPPATSPTQPPSPELHPRRVAVHVGDQVARPFRRGEPWYTQDSIRWLDENLPPGLVGIEYGGGGSTPWWCERLAKLYTVEASPMWAHAILHHMSSRHDLMAKWRLLVVNADWRHVRDGMKLKGHWVDAPDVLTPEVIAEMEKDYLTPPIDCADVVMVDGAIRSTTVEIVTDWAQRVPIRLIVVDNMEERATRESVEKLMPSRFERIDFPEKDPRLIPSGQDELVTSVFVDL